MNNEKTASQLRLAADIIETGHPWKSHPQAPDTDIYEALREEWEIRIVLATPPDSRRLHNPDHLTAEQVGAGYRLTLKGEPTNLHTEQQEYWVGDKWEASGEVFSDTFDEAQNARCTYRLPLSVPWPPAPPAPPDPYAELKAAQAAGKVIQFNPGDSLGWRDHPCDFTVGPEYYRIKPEEPFQLPQPPPGMRWHREDGWKADDLPSGYRPLVAGEKVGEGDEVRHLFGSWAVSGNVDNEPAYRLKYRTTRPLTFNHAGKTWTWHKPGDPMPCDGERKVCLIFNDGKPSCASSKANVWEWDEQGFTATIIGWRYAEPETKTVELGPEDCPPGSVFTKFSDGSYYSPSLVSVALDGIYFHDTEAFRKHYAELKKEGWQINRSIPLTGKWNADAWKPCSKQVQP